MVYTVRDRVTPAMCAVCPFADGGIPQPGIEPKRVNGRARGLGDTVADTLEWFGFKKKRCGGGCGKRQAKLNRWFPYRRAKMISIESTELASCAVEADSARSA